MGAAGPHLPRAGEIRQDARSDADYARARQALDRALALDPELSIAISYAAQLDIEQGRSREATVRLLQHLERQPDEPHLLAGLVQACRYCGLVEASIAAHELVRRLDRVMPTGVVHTYWLKGDYQRALEETRGSAESFAGTILSSMGRDDEALASFERDEARFAGTIEADFCHFMRLAVQRDGAEVRRLGLALLEIAALVDPEALYHGGRVLTRIGDTDDAVDTLVRVLDAGFCALPAMTFDPWLDPLRGRADFRALLDRAETVRQQAAAAFIAARGERLIGVQAG